jgi:phage tail-like protein
MASDKRSYSIANYSLDLDGVKCGILQEFSGGDRSGEVAEFSEAHDYYKRKQISNVKYEDYTGKFGFAMTDPVYQWIVSSLNMDYQRKSGQVNKADFKREVRSVLEFKDALISEIGFPACDGGSKEPAHLSLKWTPWITRHKKGGGDKVQQDVNIGQKVWLPANFSFVVDGVDGCTKIQKVDALTVNQQNIRDANGEERDYMLEPSSIKFPNVKLTLSAEFDEAFQAWFEDFVINGNCDASKEKTATLVYKDQTRTKDLCTLNFMGCGIFKITSNALKNNADELAVTTVEMYCESIQAAFSAG